MTSNHHNLKKHGKNLFTATIFLGVTSVALLWGWNTLAVEIFSQQPLQFRHALAMESICFAFLGLLAAAWHFFGGQRK